MKRQTLDGKLHVEDRRLAIGIDVLNELFGARMIEPLFRELPSLEIRDAEQVLQNDPNRLTFKGKTALPGLHLPEDSGVVVGLEMGNGAEDDVRATLRFNCPIGWKLVDSFPGLPVMDGPEPFIGSLQMVEAQFILSSHDDERERLRKGLNLVASAPPAGMLSTFHAALAQAQSVRIVGFVVLPMTNDAVRNLQEGELPWEVEAPVPGICLDVDLGLGLSLGADTTVTLGAKIYSPPSQDWVLDHPGYEPTMAYVGAVAIPGGRVTLTARRWSPQDDELVIKGAFELAPQGDHAAALKHLIGEGSVANLLPESVRNAVGQLELADVAFHLVAREEGGYALAATRLTIGFHHDPGSPWSPPGGLLGIMFDKMRLVAVSPVDGGRPQFSATLQATADIWGVQLAVTVEAPDFSVFAERIGGQLDLDKLFEKILPEGTPRPPRFNIDHLSLIVQPGAYYAFSLTIAPDDSWRVIEGYELPNVRLSVSSAGWQFEARVDDGAKAVPVFELVKKLAVEIPALRGLEVPRVLEKLAVDAVTVAYDSENKDFSLEFEGSLELAASGAGAPHRVEASVTVDVTDGGKEFSLGGSLVLDAGSDAPLEFDLGFGVDGESSILLAGFHDRRGHPVRVRDLLHAIPVSREVVDGIPAGLEFTLHDAVFAYRRDKNEEWRCLLGLDVEGGLDLSAPTLPGLPLVGGWSSADEPLKLALQIIVAKGDLAPGDVGAIKALGKAGTFLPDDGVRDGVHLTAALRVGEATRRLSVPIGLHELAGEGKEPGEGPRAGSAATAADLSSVDGTQWFKIQKSFGPVHVARVGVNYQDDKVWALIDAALAVAGLTISLDGLSASTRLKPLRPTFGLHGLGIDYRNDQLEIGGAFLEHKFLSKEKDDKGDLIRYPGFAGSAVVRAKDLTLSASGVFVQLKDHPSLFLYAVLDHTLGGPAFFFVTGLAAGLGYNRALVIPAVEELEKFPLIAQAKGGSRLAPMDALNELERCIPPAVGESFLAVGVRFTSFKMVDSFALLVGRLAQRFEIDLLGVSTLVSPPSPPPPTGAVKVKPPITPIAEAKLALKATFVPAEGTLFVRALLTPESYVLSRDCRLSGGFAFYAWFKDAPGVKAGDFVATLGGYHPAFRPPAHYPVVPRLQLQWRVNDHLSIKGSAYFALTAHALMAGGLLDAVWHDGDVRASFAASADFLLAWQPYYYDARVAVVMRAEVTIHAFGTHHLTFDAGANLHLSGPEFSGTADIHVRVLTFDVSFNVAFGDDAVLPEAVGWKDFRDGFLPKDLCGVGIQGGLVKAVKGPKGDAAGPERWIVDPKHAAFSITSAVPITDPKYPGLGIAPMGIAPDGQSSGFDSRLEIKVRDENGVDVTTKFRFEPIAKPVPAALWGRPRVKEMHGKKFVEPPDVNGPGLIEKTLAGFSLRPVDAVSSGEPGALDLQHGESDPVEGVFPWGNRIALDALKEPPASRDELDASAREAMLAALRFPPTGSVA